MPLKEEFRRIAESGRHLTTDAEGREIFVGLTFAETEEFLRLSNLDPEDPTLSPEERAANTDRYLELHDRHEAARMRVVAAEGEADGSTHH